jgi:hypothetical protein
MGAWHETKEALLGIGCEFQPICPHCFNPLRLYKSKVLRFYLDAKKGKRGHAIDVETICNKCRHWEVFGVPISKEHYKEVSEAIKGMASTLDIEENQGNEVGEG